MISANIILDNQIWKRKIKTPSTFFNKIVKAFPIKYKFNGKKVNLTVLLSENKHIKKFDQHRKQKHALIINPGIKTKESFLNKANGVFEGDYTQILDLYRASIIVENLKDIPILLNDISDKHSFLQQHFRIVNKENKFKKPTTYKSIKINI